MARREVSANHLGGREVSRRVQDTRRHTSMGWVGEGGRGDFTRIRVFTGERLTVVFCDGRVQAVGV